jgi:Outer membrane protein beta-barrel domain
MRYLKYSLIGIFICISSSANSQVILSLLFGDKLNSDELLFGIHMHYSWNDLSGTDPSSSLKKFNIGLFLTYKVNDQWQLNTEVMAKYQRGATGMTPYSLNDPQLDATFANGEFTRSVGYIALPVTTRYVMAEKFFLEAGPNIAFRINAEDVFKMGISQGDQKLEINSKELTSSWDVGMLFGAGYYLGKGRDLAMGIRYAAGFSDVSKDVEGEQTHNGFYLYGNIPIGRAKAQAKRASQPK